MQMAMRNRIMKKVDADNKAKFYEVMESIKQGNIFDKLADIRELKKSRDIQSYLAEGTST